MCILHLSYREFPEYPFILLHNRDEYYERPTETAAFWPEEPGLLAGRDLKWGGTWLGFTRRGRFGAVTNYRDPRALREHGLSRGLMLVDYLTMQIPAHRFLTDISRKADNYPGFNLLIGSVDELHYYSNMGSGPRRLSPGRYSLSNHLLDTPWPKVRRIRTLFERTVSTGRFADVEHLLRVLDDRQPAPDDQLPDTGVGQALERVLSSVFITSETYGTRASTVITVDHRGRVVFVEKGYSSPSDRGTVNTYRFALE